jgi:hypothetical protein
MSNEPSRVRQLAEQLLTLPDSRRPNPEAVRRALQFAEGATMVPIYDGGVQLEWHQNGYDLEIEFFPDGKMVVFLAYEVLPRAR